MNTQFYVGCLRRQISDNVQNVELLQSSPQLAWPLGVSIPGPSHVCVVGYLGSDQMHCG